MKTTCAFFRKDRHTDIVVQRKVKKINSSSHQEFAKTGDAAEELKIWGFLLDKIKHIIIRLGADVYSVHPFSYQ